jgi:hypothetical protein
LGDEDGQATGSVLSRKTEEKEKDKKEEEKKKMKK